MWPVSLYTIDVTCVKQTDHAGRLQDTGVPAVENGSLVTDFAWDPFNNSRLAVGMLLIYLFFLLYSAYLHKPL